MNKFLNSSNNFTIFFSLVYLSFFSNNSFYYGGDKALNHTKNEIDKFRKVGIEVLSFFVADSSSYGRESNMVDFKRMYGNDSSFIDPTNLISLAKVLNKKFLTK